MTAQEWYCAEEDCHEEGCSPQAPCCRGNGCACQKTKDCATVVADYLDDGSSVLWCTDHELEFVSS